ncbi:flavodoxin domain-containing protein [Clostridium sp.]|uniref:flavodoxin domain-containing protein n=1 Tax=Clostridium sp. TaxID=1506 RepID=UPI003D6D952B
MNTVVIYKSKTGFAKKYAEWIAKDLSADIFDVSKITIKNLIKYDTIIYGGSLYAVGINGVKLITNNIEKLKDKKVIVFSTGVSPLTVDGIIDVRNKNFTPVQQKHIKFFYLRGGFNYNHLTPFDKILMTLLKWKIKSKKEEKLTTDERGMLALYHNPVDFTKKKNIDEIINCVTS